MKPLAIGLWVPTSIILSCLATLGPTTAQIVPDNTLPVNSNVTLGGTVYTIDGGTIQGTNLFHSFSEFGVPTGGEAYFNNEPQIQNILTRVTGNSVSNIDGLLRANGTANLFLINPNGITFGANATLNLGGSFIASTATSFVFADGTVFSAKPDTSTPPLLTISVPIGLQYGTNPGRIVVQGNGKGVRPFDAPVIDTDFGLRVQEDQTLALIGGELNMEGATLKTAGGRIELGSVAGPGLVSLTPINKGWALGYQGVSTLGDIQMSQLSVADASGLGGGDVQAWGRRVTLTGGSQMEASTLGDQPGGTLVVNATELVEVIGESADRNFPSGLLTYAYAGSSGKAGELTINTGSLLMRDGAQVGVITLGQGDGGKLTVNASKGVQLIGTSADGLFRTTLWSQSDTLSSDTSGGTRGNGGDITINTGTLLVQDGATIDAGTWTQGNGGKLTINATQQVLVIGTPKVTSDPSQQGLPTSPTTSPDAQSPSRLTAQARPGASGKGGDMTINTPTLLVQDGAEVTVLSEQGQAGNMTILANSVLLNRGTLIAATAKSDAQGGANITLSGLDLLRMDNENRISANALDLANGGNITIDSTFIVATPPTGPKGSDITANADKGNGGAVNIITQGLYGIQFRPQLTPKNDITTSSEFGLAGQVNVNQLAVDPTQGLVELPETLTDPSNQIVTGCAAAQGNSFTVTGRGGLPEDPTALIRGQTVLLDFRDFSQGTGVGQVSPQNPQALIDKSSPRLVEANSWVYGSKGEVILIATVPTVTPHGTWPPAVNCHQVTQSNSQ